MTQTVLVIDDDWLNRELLEAVLESGGYRVLLANSADEALRVALEHQPPLVVLDVNLRYEEEGFVICRELKTRLSPPPKVLMISGLDLAERREKAQQVGADGFLDRTRGNDALLKALKAL